MSTEWQEARSELERAIVAAVKRFEDRTGMTLSVEIRYVEPGRQGARN